MLRRDERNASWDVCFLEGSKSRKGGNFDLEVYWESRSYGQVEGEAGMWGSKGVKGKGDVLYLYDSEWNQSFRTSAELDTRSLERTDGRTHTRTHTFFLSFSFVLDSHEARPPGRRPHTPGLSLLSDPSARLVRARKRGRPGQASSRRGRHRAGQDNN
ncbi:hypothetical protein LX36DRAFT_221072 [Colletotrichum falcatum]|nr:hypothetical protein LX36DRAFT_221072 [Colletotrichum falcatum]